MADFLEAGEVPQVGKIPALLRLHRLNGAVIAVEENTFTVWLLLQDQTAAIRAKSHELLDEVVFAQALEGRDPGKLGAGHAHLARPATAGSAALTFMEDRHGVSVVSSTARAKRSLQTALQFPDEPLQPYHRFLDVLQVRRVGATHKTLAAIAERRAGNDSNSFFVQ